MNNEEFSEFRERLHEALSEIVRECEEDEGVISGWILCYEQVHPEDVRSLSVVTSDATGVTDISPWAGEGILRHVASNYEMYSSPDEDDSDEEDDDD